MKTYLSIIAIASLLSAHSAQASRFRGLFDQIAVVAAGDTKPVKPVVVGDNSGPRGLATGPTKPGSGDHADFQKPRPGQRGYSATKVIQVCKATHGEIPQGFPDFGTLTKVCQLDKTGVVDLTLDQEAVDILTASKAIAHGSMCYSGEALSTKEAQELYKKDFESRIRDLCYKAIMKDVAFSGDPEFVKERLSIARGAVADVLNLIGGNLECTPMELREGAKK